MKLVDAAVMKLNDVWQICYVVISTPFISFKQFHHAHGGSRSTVHTHNYLYIQNTLQSTVFGRWYCTRFAQKSG